MMRFGTAGMVLLKREIARREYGLQGLARASGVSHVRLKRVLLGGVISKEEMELISKEMGWPVKYLVR